jgi:hypothetical protein
MYNGYINATTGQNEMTRYEREIMTLSASAMTASALEAGMKQIMRRYHHTERVLQTLKNGIQKIGVYDKDDNLINQYHR